MRAWVLLLLVAGCGGYDNVETCESFAASVHCGDADVRDRLDCDAWVEEDGCDLTPYFECLDDHTVCDDAADPPVLDLTGWTACADRAVCD